MELQQVARDFREQFAGKLSEAELAAAIAQIEKAEAAEKVGYGYYAYGAVASLVFYLQFELNSCGHDFFGKAGGATLPGGGALFGTLFIADGHTADELFEKTNAFWFTCALTYTALYFLDGNTLLGHFQSGSVSTVLGGGGGSGSWK